jgi:hypothetical protein
MYMVGHKAISPNFDAALPVGHEFDVRMIVIVVEKRPLAAIAALSDMVGHPGNDNSR